MAGKTKEQKMVERMERLKEATEKRKKEEVQITLPPTGTEKVEDIFLSINGKTITLQQDPYKVKTYKVPRPFADLYKEKMRAIEETQATRRRVRRQYTNSQRR